VKPEFAIGTSGAVLTKEPEPEHRLSETAHVMPETSVDSAQVAGSGRSAQVWVGMRLGQYQVCSVLGQGAMGIVLKAFDPLIEREVAIKVLAGQLATDPAALARFHSEARAAGKLNHPNVMAIYGICQEGEDYFLVLEYVAGGSLSDRIAGRGPLPVVEATQALIDACKGVGAAHAAGLIHRDIKPANFMRAANGSIKVADFGLAKVSAEIGRGTTQAGTVLGTPFFMSPEQCEAKPVDHRSDIYSLGATYYSLLTGKNPYHDAGSVPQLLFQHCHGPVPDPRTKDSSIPDACARIVARAMAKDPAERYQSTSEMLADLQTAMASLAGETWVAVPASSAIASPQSTRGAARKTRAGGIAWVVGGAVLAIVAALSMFLWKPWQSLSEKHELPVAAAISQEEPIRIGVLHSLTGTMADSEAPVVDAVLFAVAELNEAGGVLGRPVEAVVADGRSDDAVFAQEAKRLITEEKVCTLFGCWTSASRKTVRPVVESHDHLLMYPVQFEGLEASPNIQYLGAAPNQQILPAVEWAISTLDKKRFFLVGSDYVFPHAAHEIIKDFLQARGAEVVGEAFAPLGSQKFDEIVAAIAAARPDMILNTINGDSNIAFFRALRAARIASAETPTLSFSIGEQGLRSLNPAELAGEYAACTYFESLASPENQGFVKKFREQYPHHSVTDPMETAYMGVKLWAQAVNEAHSLEPKKIRRALLSQRWKGPEGEIRIDSDTQYTYKTPRIAKIEANGLFQVVWSAPAPLEPEPYPSSRSAEAWQAFLHDLYAGWGNRWVAP
jgi:urea transport system substrate-binding protein